MRTVVLLGSQRLTPTLVQAVEKVGVDGPVAAVTAGWEEREDEIDELSDHLHRPVANLHLYARVEDVFRRDPEFFDAWQERRARLRELQELHRTRLDHAMRALRDLRKRESRADLVEPEREDAIAEVRRLDARHVGRVDAIHRDFESRWRPQERAAVQRHATELGAMARACAALAIAGGNVSVLLNRMRLFQVPRLFPGRPVFAWSAGAMAMTERVVLYHDDPPWGRGNPVVLGPGFGVAPGVVALPHAHRRLRLDPPSRLRLWRERFAPLQCVTLPDGAWIVFRDGRPAESSGGVQRFGSGGQLEEFAAS